MRSALESTLALNNRISKIKMWGFFSKLVLTFMQLNFECLIINDSMMYESW